MRRRRRLEGRVLPRCLGVGSGSTSAQTSAEASSWPTLLGQRRRGVVEREQAALGVLLTLNAPTKAMRTEAASAGFYASPWGQHPRVQILTVGELLAGKKLNAPPPRQTSLTYKRAPKALKKAGEQAGMFGDG